MTQERPRTREKLRAVFLSALVILSVFAGSMGFVGSVAAETAGNTGPSGFTDQAANAGTLTAGETGVVQEIKITDGPDAAGNDVTIDSFDVDLSDSGISASDIASVSIHNDNGELGTASVADLSEPISVDLSEFAVTDDDEATLYVQVAIASDATGHGTLSVSSRAHYIEGDDSGTTDFVADDGGPKTVDGSPTVTDYNLNKSVVSQSDAPATVAVDVTFSENVMNESFEVGDIQLTGEEGDLDVSGSITGDQFTGTVTVGADENVDYVPHLRVSGINDEAGNSVIAYDEQTDLEVDTDLSLELDSASTADLDDDGTVEIINATFTDDVDDESVLTAIENNEFNLKDGNVEGINGGESNDATVSLEVSGVGDTAATDEITVFSGVLEDSVGNPGPNGPTGITVSDGAAPAVDNTSINKTTINESLAVTDIEVNATFSEDVSGTYDAGDVQLTGLPDTGDQDVTGSLVASDKFSGTVSIPNNEEDTKANLTITGLDDSSSNTVDYEGLDAITVDTLPPTVEVNSTEAPEGEIVSGTLDLTTYFDITDDDSGETTYLINTTAGGSNFTEVENPSEFDSTQIEDTNYLNVKAVDTDDVENSDRATTADINVDNTAPAITINSPTDTQVSQSDGTLSVDVTVDEPNIDGDATVVLYGDDNEIRYNVPITDGDNNFDLLLNASANAGSASPINPDVENSNGSFDTKTVYDLYVTVDDQTDKSTTATETDVLFLDDTAPEGFGLIAPDEPTEYDFSDNDELQIAYGYTENNTGSVTVSLTDEAGTVASTTVDESQYVDDGVIKSFELDLLDSFDTSTLADGRYNVTLTVTDEAGNELVENTSNAPVAINDDDNDAADPQFNSGPDATASINESSEEVTIDVTYNVSVPEVQDVGDLDQTQDTLERVDITADNVGTLTGTYWDESEESYDTFHAPVSVDFADENTTANASVTETATVDLSTIDTPVSEDDRVLDRSVNLNGEVDVTATDNSGDTTSASDGVSGDAPFVTQDPVPPTLENVEVLGPDVYNSNVDLVGFDPGYSSVALEINFSRPVQSADGSVTADDFAYQDVSGDGANYVTDVYSVNDGDTTVVVQLNEPVTADDVSNDILSIQPDVLENAEYPAQSVSADSGVVNDTDAPRMGAAVQDNASTVTVLFDQPVEAGDGGNLTKANLTYTGSSDIRSVTQTDANRAVVTLNADVTSEEIDSAEIRTESDQVFDRFGNSQANQATVNDGLSPSNMEIVQPDERTVKQSDDLLDITYRYVENVPDNTESVTVTLISEADGTEYTYDIDDSQYVDDGVEKSLTLDLSKGEGVTNGNLDDGSYDVEVTATDAQGLSQSVTSETPYVVINDDAPTVDSVSVDPSSDVAPNATVDVNYRYEDATKATSVTVYVVDAEDAGNFTDGEREPVTFSTVEKNVDHASGDQTVTVDLTGIVADNEDYEVFVSATDESDFENNASEQTSASLDVNAEAPSIDSVEANAGENTVTVEFSEDVVAGDGDENLTSADFAYQNVNSAGADSIKSVVAHDGDTVTLRLDGDVTQSDIDSDLVNAREGQIEDTADGDHARTVDTSATVLDDTTSPDAPAITNAPAVNAENAASYGIGIHVGDEVVDATLNISDGSSSVEATLTDVEGSATFDDVDVSGLNDTTLDVTVTVTDVSEQTESSSTTAVKDTVSPTVESVETNAGTDTLTVRFSESVSNADFTGDNVSIADVSGDGMVYTLTTAGTIQPSDIDNSSVTVSATAGTDDVGNSVDTASAKLMDDTAPSFATDALTDNSSKTVTVQFTEQVFNGNPSADTLTADNFTYVNVNGEDNKVVDVSYDEQSLTATLTLKKSVSPADLNEDYITSDAVDSVGHAVDNRADLVTSFSVTDFSVTTDSHDVTIEFTADEEVDSFKFDLKSELSTASTDGVEDLGLVTLTESDFEETDNGDGTYTYVATDTVPRDGVYDGVLYDLTSVGGASHWHMVDDDVTVDANQPKPVDAEIAGYDGETTEIAVQFSEPVRFYSQEDGIPIAAENIFIEGVAQEDIIGGHQSDTNEVTVLVSGAVQTGDSPTVSFTADAYEEYAGDTAGSTTATTVNTLELTLNDGANFVSVPAASGKLAASEVVSKLGTDNVESIMTYDDGEWKVYNPDKPADEQDFEYIKGGQGYIVTLDTADSLELEVNVNNVPGGGDAKEATPQDQQLEEGWNLVGQWQEGSQSAENALASTSDAVSGATAIYGQAAGSTGYSYAEVHTFEPGEAYWVFATEDSRYTESQAFTT